MSDITGNALITTKKSTCYLTIKLDGRNEHLMKIRQYKIEPDDKRQMRRLYPNVIFDWKKITVQLAQKREVCRSYRSRRRAPTRPRRTREPFYGVADPFTAFPEKRRKYGYVLSNICDIFSKTPAKPN